MERDIVFVENLVHKEKVVRIDSRISDILHGVLLLTFLTLFDEDKNHANPEFSEVLENQDSWDHTQMKEHENYPI